MICPFAKSFRMIAFKLDNYNYKPQLLQCQQQSCQWLCLLCHDILFISDKSKQIQINDKGCVNKNGNDIEMVWQSI